MINSRKTPPIIGNMISNGTVEKTVYMSRDAPNDHINITGVSGTGKSTFALGILVQQAIVGRKVLALNYFGSLNHDSMNPNIRKYYEEHANVIKVGKDEPVRIPLLKRKNLEDEEMIVDRVTSFFAKAGNLSASQENRMNKAVRDALAPDDGTEEEYSSKGVKSVGERLMNQKSFTAENAFSKLRGLFRGNLIQNGDFLENKGIIEIDMGALPKDTQMVLTMFILAYVETESRYGRFLDEGLTILLDEFEKFEFDKNGILFDLMNMSRKQNIQMILTATSLDNKSMRGYCNQCCFQIAFREYDMRKIKRIAEMAGIKKNLAGFMARVSSLKVGEFYAMGDFMAVDRYEEVDDDLRRIILNTYIPLTSDCCNEPYAR